MYRLLKKLVGSQYLEVHKILFPLEILVPLQFLQNLRGTAYVELINVQDPGYKNAFDNYDLATTSNFLLKLGRNKYLCVQLRILVPSQILVPFYMLWKA